MDPVLEVTNMRRGGRCSAFRRRGRKASVTLRAPMRLVSRTVRNASRVGGLAMEMIPALLTRISNRPHSEVRLRAATSTDASSVTSNWILETVPLMFSSDRSSVAATSPLASSRLPIMTW